MMRGWVWYAAVLALGVVLYLVSRLFPADLPMWLPWEFSWPEYLATALTLGWFGRGLRVLPRDQHLPLWRSLCFVAGVFSFWIVHRAAHFVLHHFGAFFIAMGMSGPVLWAGMPDFLKPVMKARPVQATVSFLQHPVMAPFLFVGLLYFWLIPQIHTRVMLDAHLYELMNWTMAINGVMFWSLILDSRAKPPARLSHLMRAALILVIELPQMVLGSILSLTEHDIYPVYTICGRVLDMTALNDQHYGGLIIWLPGTLTSFAAMIVVLVTMRLNEERAALEENKSEAA
jgi:putative membrane protein